MSIPLFQQDGFRIGIGDANRDGIPDLDFGLRSESWGNSPFGFGHSGAEIGFNTDRGVYAGTDYSNHNAWGSSGGGARVFGDGGFESGNWSNDVFGNYNQGYQNSSPFGFESSHAGGNVFSGNYHGHQTNVNAWGASHSDWGGNSWTGAHASNHQYGNVFGGGGSFSTYSPPQVPHWGGNHHQCCGCRAAGGFFGW